VDLEVKTSRMPLLQMHTSSNTGSAESWAFKCRIVWSGTCGGTELQSSTSMSIERPQKGNKRELDSK